MVPGDIQAVVKVEQAAFSLPWSQEAFCAEMKNEMAYYLVMEQDNQIIGYAGMWMVFDEAHVTNVAILPQYHGQGLGTKLMSGLIEYAKLQGAHSMTLEVRTKNAIAQKLYMKLDFVLAGLRPNYYTETQEDALIMWRYKL
jgi:ribosomal-protein-alanine N-acetyltransferase